MEFESNNDLINCIFFDAILFSAFEIFHKCNQSILKIFSLTVENIIIFIHKKQLEIIKISKIHNYFSRMNKNSGDI